MCAVYVVHVVDIMHVGNVCTHLIGVCDACFFECIVCSAMSVICTDIYGM